MPFLIAGLVTCYAVGPSQQNPTVPQLLAQKKYAEAEVAVLKVLETNPGAGQAWINLGLARQGQQKYKEALEAYQKAAAIPPVRSTAFYNSACIYSLTKESDMAIEALKSAILAGFDDRRLLASDPELANVRRDSRFGKLMPPILKDSQLFTEKTKIIHQWHGEGHRAEFGWIARQAGDIDQDGVLDIGVTSPGFNNQAGKLYVYSGKSGKKLWTFVGAEGERLGQGPAAPADLNGDGVVDIVIGGPAAGAGTVYALNGKNGSVIYKITGAANGDQFGTYVEFVPDLDGDNVLDYAVASIGAKGKVEGSGSVSIHSGKDGKTLYTIGGERAGDTFGTGLAVDGRFLYVGAASAGEGQHGEVYAFELDKLKFKPRFSIKNRPESAGLGQFFLSNVGDMNGDGMADIFCSDFGDSKGGAGTGRVLVFSGRDGKPILDFNGKVPGENLGTSVSNAGDVNHDGKQDLIVGAWQNANGARSGGKVYLFSGSDGKELAAWTCRQAGDTFGFDAQGVGDIDGDGAIDFLLTSAWSNVKYSRGGRTFVIAGPKN